MASELDPTQDEITARRAVLGRELRERRQGLEITQKQLARQIGYSRSAVANAEIGYQHADRDFWERCDRALAAGGVLTSGHDKITALRQARTDARALAARSERDAKITQCFTDPAQARPDGPDRGPAGTGDGVPVNRREFMALVGTALAGAMVRSDAVLRDLTLVLVDHAPTIGPESDLSVPALTDGLARMKTAYQACNYQLVADELPDLLARARAGAQFVAGDDRLDVAAVDAQLHHVGASVLLKMDSHALAAIAADRSMSAAQQSGDPVTVAASARIVAHTLMAAGQHDAAHRYAQRQAEAFDAELRAPDVGALSVYGALLLRGAVAAATAEDSAGARSLLDEAERAGAQVTGPANHHWTAFCWDNVLAHRVAVEVVLGNAGTAVEHLKRIRFDNLGIAERKATVCIDAARAYTQWDKHDRAITALLAAEQVSPAELRLHPATRELLQRISSAGPPSAQSDLKALIDRVGIAA